MTTAYTPEQSEAIANAVATMIGERGQEYHVVTLKLDAAQFAIYEAARRACCGLSAEQVVVRGLAMVVSEANLKGTT